MSSYDVKFVRMEMETPDLKYVQIAEEEGDDTIEIPLEEDSTLLLTTLTAIFPNACGLKYRNPTSSTMRGLRVADGKIHAPDGGWGDSVTYYGVFPKVADNKRKNDDALDEFYGRAVSKRSLSEEQVCSDLIVLGLAFSTTEEDLREYCEKFGEVVMVKVNKDTKTGKPKGFGFVKYKDYENQVKVLKQRHEINDRWCDIKIPYSNKQHGQPRRFYIGRVPESLTTEDLRTYFSTFGELADVFIPRPHRDFAFVTFADSTTLNNLNGQDHIVKNVSVCVKLATPKHVPAKNNQQQQGGGNNQNAWANAPPPPPDMPNLQSLGLNLQQNNGIPQNVQNAFQNTVGYLSSQYANSVNVMQNYLQQQKGANSGGGNQGGYGGGSNTGGYGSSTQGYGDGNASGYGASNTAYGTGSSMGGYGGSSAGYGGGSSGSQNVGYPPPRTNTTTGYSDSGSSVPRPPVEPCPPPTPDSRLAYHTS